MSVIYPLKTIIRWRVPVHCAPSKRGMLGTVGHLLIDATTGELIATTTTNGRGGYSFSVTDGLGTGQYQVVLADGAGHMTTPVKTVTAMGVPVLALTRANLGGSSRRPLVTAYRENAIQIACYLADSGEMEPRQLRAQAFDFHLQRLAAEREAAVVFPPFYFGQIYEARCFPGTLTLKPRPVLGAAVNFSGGWVFRDVETGVRPWVPPAKPDEIGYGRVWVGGHDFRLLILEPK